MPDHEGWFFWFLRRFNTLMMTVFGLLVLGVIGYQLCNNPIIRHNLFGTPVPPFAIPGMPAVTPGFRVQAEAYATPGAVYGPQVKFLYVLVHSKAPAANVSSIYPVFHAGDATNVMIVDEKTGEGHWLFTGTDRGIVARDAIYQGAPVVNAPVGVDPRPVIGLVMWVAQSDTNKDGQLTQDDAVTLYSWHQGETSAVKMLSADDVLTGGQEGADRYMVVYRQGKTLKSAFYSVPDFKLLSEKVLPEPPH